MRPFLGLLQLEAGAAHHDLVAEIHEHGYHLLEGQGSGTAVHESHVVDREAALESGVLEEHVQHHVRVRILLEQELYAYSVTVGEVAYLGYALNLLVARHLPYTGLELGLVDHIGNLGHDYGLTSAGKLLYFGLGAQDYPAPAGAVGVHDALAAYYNAAGGEIRALDVLHKPGGVDVRVVDESANRVTALAEIVRGHVGGHSDGDARRTVEQQQRRLRGQHRGLLEGVVEIERHVDGVLVNVGQDLGGKLLQLGLGISHGRNGIAVHRAEITLSVYQRISLVPVLGETCHRVVHAGVSVGMELTKHLTHDTGGLLRLSAIA